MAPENTTTQAAQAERTARPASGQTVNVPAPAEGERHSVVSSPAGELVLGFDPADATASRPEGGNDLVFTVDGGGTVTITDFFVVGDESLPNLKLPDGTVVASEDFFAGSDLDMSTAAGTAGAPPSGGSDGSGDDLLMTGGINKLGVQGTWFWGRNNEVAEEMVGENAPGGSFTFGVLTDDGFAVLGGVYEDGRPDQHLYGAEAEEHPGRIQMSFTSRTDSTPTQVVFDLGANAERGCFGTFDSEGNFVPGVEHNGSYTFTADQVTSGDVFFVPARDNNDADISLNVTVTFRNSANQTAPVTQPCTIIVDAVADRPDMEEGTGLGVTGHAEAITVSEREGTEQKLEDGWATDDLHKETYAPGTGAVTYTVPVTANVTFYDFSDGSESHYVLIGVPDSAGVWSCPVANVLINGAPLPNDAEVKTITLWFDSNGKVVGESSPGESFSAEGYANKDLISKNFFQVEVPASMIPDGSDAGEGGPAAGAVTVQADLKASGTDYGADQNFSIDIGAKAVESPTDRGELTEDNNVSYNFGTVDGDTSGYEVNLDTVDSRLTVKVGWASEGNDNSKHADDYTPQYDKMVDRDDMDMDIDRGNVDGVDEASYNTHGAPIIISIEPSEDPGGQTESITQITITFASGSGTLVNGAGDPLNGEDSGSFTFQDADGNTFAALVTYNSDTETYTFTFDENAGVTSLQGVYFQPPEGSYSDIDVPLSYTVSVAAGSGATALYTGSTTVVIDAVADRADIDASFATNNNGETAPGFFVDEAPVEETAGSSTPDAGWFSDEFAIPVYSSVEHQLTVTVTTTFHDLDGSEKHYVLVQDLSEDGGPQWSIAGASDNTVTIDGVDYTYTSFTDPDGNTYFKIDVTDQVEKDDSDSLGQVTLAVPMTVTGVEGDLNLGTTITTGSIAEEVGLGEELSGQEYDKFDPYVDDVDDVAADARIDNNIALNFSSAEYSIDVISSGLGVKAGWASEGNNDAKYLGRASTGHFFGGQTGEGQATLEDANHLNLGAPIEVTLINNNANTGDSITSITVSHNGDGSFFLGGEKLNSSMSNMEVTFTSSSGEVTATVTYDESNGESNGKFIITFAEGSEITSLSGTDLYYQPNGSSYSDDDVTIEYEVKVENSVGSSAIFKGSTTVVIDAVADKATVTGSTDSGFGNDAAAQVAYKNEEGDDDEVSYIAARPGGQVELSGTVRFPDTDGSETHTIKITPPDNNKDTISKITITVDGVSYMFEITGQVITPHGDGWGAEWDEDDNNFVITIPKDADDGTTYSATDYDVKVSIDVANTHIANATPNITVTAVAREEATVYEDSASVDDYEYDGVNNSAETSATWGYKVGVATAQVKLVTVAVFEGDDGNQHFSTDPLLVDQTSLFSTPVNSITNTGALKFTLSGDAEDYIARLYIEYVQAHGVLQYDGQTIPSGTMLVLVNGSYIAYGPDGTPIDDISIPKAHLQDDADGIKYVPNRDDDSSVDVAINFAATVVDGHSGDVSISSNMEDEDLSEKGLNGADGRLTNDIESSQILSDQNITATSSGAAAGSDSAVVVDAVADLPMRLDVAKVEHPEIEGVPDFGKFEPGAAATIKIDSVQFADYQDGSEQHYLLVQGTGISVTYGDSETATATATVTLAKSQTITITGTNTNANLAVEYTLTITIDADGNAASYRIAPAVEEFEGGTISSVGESSSFSAQGSDYLAIPVPNEFLQLVGGQVSAEFQVTLPADAALTGDAKLSINVGAGAIDSENDFSPLGGISDLSTTTGNDKAAVVTPVTVHIGKVTSAPAIGIENGKIFENLTPNAHGEALDPEVSGLTEGDTSSPGATITVGGIAQGETASITFTFTSLDGKNSFESVKEDDLMRLELLDGNSDGVPSSYQITYDEENDVWTVTVEVPGTDADTDATFIFKPGYNYNASDINVGYTVTVTDDSSGHSKAWTNSSSAADGSDTDFELQSNPLKIEVDAVAQQAEITDTRFDYGKSGGTSAAVKGGLVYITSQISFEDYTDDSEAHYILVQAQIGWKLESISIGDDSDPIVTFGTPVPLKVNGEWGMYYRIPVDNATIATTEGILNLSIEMQSSTNSADDTTFRIGAQSWETKDALDSDKDNITMDNNRSYVWTQTDPVLFDSASAGRAEVRDTYEDLQENKHKDDQTESDPGAITFRAGEGDVITQVTMEEQGGYTFAEGEETDTIDVFLSGQPVGTLRLSEGSEASWKIEDGQLVISPSGGDTSIQGGIELTFTPAPFSDVDFTFTSTIGTKNIASGNPRSTQVTHTLVVDAVADMATDVGHANVGEPITASLGGLDGNAIYTFDLPITATFPDTDRSETHYVLVEAKANMVIFGENGTEIKCEIHTERTYDETGELTEQVSYYMVPIDECKLDAATDTYTVTVGMKSLGTDNPKSIKIGALATEEMDGTELTNHNNVAFAEGGEVTVAYSGGGSGVTVFVYENNTPEAHKGDDSTTYGKVEGLDGEAGNAESVTITVPAGVELCKGPGQNADPYDDPDIDYDNGTWTYTISSDDSGGFVEIYVKLPEGYNGGNNDEDFSLTYSFGTSANATEAKVVVDAVAQQPTDLTAVVGYSDPQNTDGEKYTAMGEKDEAGNDGEAWVTISGKFADTDDGSETHYALIEHKPGFTVADENAETVYLDGKAYYRVEITEPPSQNGVSSVTVKVLVSNPSALDPGGVSLLTGLMTVENPTDTEARGDNNISWTLTDGNGDEVSVKLEVSKVESRVGVAFGLDHIQEDSSMFLSFTGDIKEGETLVGNFELKPSHGTLTIYQNGEVLESENLPAGVTLEGGKLIITNQETLENFLGSNPAYKVRYTPEENNDTDVQWTIVSKFKDIASGDVDNSGSRTQTMVIDAVADTGNTKVLYDSEAFIAASEPDGTSQPVFGIGEEDDGIANVEIELSFTDTDGSETHYAVLKQFASDGPSWTCTGIQIYDEGTRSWSDPALPITVFTKDGTPCYGIQLDGEAESVKVRFVMQAPAGADGEDIHSTLEAGWISVENNMALEGDGETDLLNNYEEGFERVNVGLGLVTTDEITSSPSTGEEDDFCLLSFEINGDNETLYVTIAENQLRGGTLHRWVPDEDEENGGHWENVLVDGEAGDATYTLTDAANTQYAYKAAANASGEFELAYTAKVTDNASGDAKEFAEPGTVTVNVAGVADAPTLIAAPEFGAWTDNGNLTASVQVTLSGTFTDLTGENHYFLLAQPLPDGLTLSGNYSTTEIEGRTYHLIPAADHNVANATATITLIADSSYQGDEISVSGMSKETDATNDTSDVVPGATPSMPPPPTDMTSATASITIPGGATEGGTLDLSLLLQNGLENNVTLSQAATMTFVLSGIALEPGTYNGDPSVTVEVRGSGEYLVTVTGNSGGNIQLPIADDNIIGNGGNYEVRITDVTVNHDDITPGNGVVSVDVAVADDDFSQLPGGFDSADVQGMHLFNGEDLNQSDNTNNVFLLGSDNGDEIHGGAGNDIIYAGAGEDIIHISDGDDLIYAGTGTNVPDTDGGTGLLNGDGEQDIFVWDSIGSGNTTIHGFEFAAEGEEGVTDKVQMLTFSDIFGNAGFNAAELGSSGLTVTSSPDNGQGGTCFSFEYTGEGGTTTTLEACFMSDTQLQLTLSQQDGGSSQSITLNAAEGDVFYGGADPLTDAVAAEILQQILKSVTE